MRVNPSVLSILYIDRYRKQLCLFNLWSTQYEQPIYDDDGL